MTPEDFAIRLHATVIVESTETYRDLFLHTSPEEASDTYWKKALSLFNSLPPEQRETFFEILRQVATDTASHVLGVIDGVSFLEGFDNEFQLTQGHDKRLLSGDLQSIFLATEERMTR